MAKTLSIRDYKDAKDKRRALEENLKISLPAISNFSFDEKTASTRNCENMIGAAHIPLGIAGPLKVNNKEYFVPLATTEGALVASVNRGAKAITLGGGARVVGKKVGITRAPVFKVDGLDHGQKLIKWVEENFNSLKKTAESTSSHLKLLDAKSWSLGRNVYLRFHFDTQDAMGMNMATIASAAMVMLIEKGTGASCTSVSGNMCVDKKANYLNFIEGRGYSVSAEAIISKKILYDVLKTDSEKLFEVYQRKVVYGSIMSGTIGANAHFANVLSAIFLATGQDVAHIVESSMGITTIEKAEKDGIYASVYLPDVVVGVVGGGTGLATQNEALSILGVAGGGNGKNAEEFSEVIAGAVLSGELSLLSSLAENSLACAHERLGRGRIK